MYKIKDMPLNERPRERLEAHGASFLTDEELIAILIKTGRKGHSAKVVASKILVLVGGLTGLRNCNLVQLKKVEGIGLTKASVLLAVVELATRMQQEQRFINNVQVKNAVMVFNFFQSKLREKKQEHFYVLYLNSQNKVIAEKLLFIGTANKSLVHPREIFKEAFLLSAVALICVHNHPSGDPKPSAADINFTNELKKMGNLFGIGISDHVIIANDQFFSFFEDGLL